jgi:hypothetical protein
MKEEQNQGRDEESPIHADLNCDSQFGTGQMPIVVPSDAYMGHYKNGTMVAGTNTASLSVDFHYTSTTERTYLL